VVVTDARWQLLPQGVPGELLTGGEGLARGYLGRPDLTAERFVPDPFAAVPGSRLYRTGDLARWLPDGTLEFLGRIDQQVKIRGFRVEPGEIETVLGSHPGVRESVVVARPLGGDRQLVAYVVPAAAAPDALDVEELRAFLRRRLPEPMVPAAFVPLPALPLTGNGKIDRAALPAPELRRAAALPPRTPVEMVIAEVWAEILDAGGFGVHDDFFSLGGHSLNASRLVSRLRQVFGVEVPLGALFRHPTVAGLAAALLDDPARKARMERVAGILVEMEDDEDGVVEEARGAVS